MILRFLDKSQEFYHQKSEKFMQKIKILIKESEKLKGGKGDNRPDSDFDAKELENGIKHELEHTKVHQVAKEIAKDHLSEDPNYYKKLKKIEK
jgi:hypothetical protein